MEKDERKFFKELDKTEQARKEKMKGLESRRKEKENFVRKYYPTSSNSPGGTLNLLPNDVTSAGNRRLGKMNICISENFFAVRQMTNDI